MNIRTNLLEEYVNFVDNTRKQSKNLWICKIILFIVIIIIFRYGYIYLYNHTYVYLHFICSYFIQIYK